MSMRQDREAIGDERLVLYHTDVDGRFVRVFLPVLFGVFAAGGLWLFLFGPSLRRGGRSDERMARAVQDRSNHVPYGT